MLVVLVLATPGCKSNEPSGGNAKPTGSSEPTGGQPGSDLMKPVLTEDLIAHYVEYMTDGADNPYDHVYADGRLSTANPLKDKPGYLDEFAKRHKFADDLAYRTTAERILRVSMSRSKVAPADVALVDKHAAEIAAADKSQDDRFAALPKPAP